jgi:S-formylglutathione hydrolase FrmB
LYRADPARLHRAIGGLSRGAGWALRIALQRADEFAAVGLHSPAVIMPDLFLLPIWLEDVPPAWRPRVWIDIGERDSLRRSTEELVGLLEDIGLPLEWRLRPGEHTPEYWSNHMDEYLAWYTQDW